MSDLIDRADAIKAVKMLYITKPRINNDYVYDMAIDNAMDVITLVPSAERTGKWKMCKDEDGIYGVCSLCRWDADFSYYRKAYKFCPNCGARMVSE